MIYLGKLLQKDDLPIFVYNNDVLIDPYYISYSICDCTTGKCERIRQTLNSIPMRFDVGSYFIPIHLDPLIFRVGRHVVRWVVQKYFDSSKIQSSNEFYVSRSPFYSGEFCRSTYPITTNA